MQGLLGGLLGGGGAGGRPRPRAAAVAPTLEAHARACASAADLTQLLQHWAKLLSAPRDGEALLFEAEGDAGAGAGSPDAGHPARVSFADVLLSSGAVEVVCSLCVLNEEVRTTLLKDDSGAPAQEQDGGPESLLGLLDGVLRQAFVRQGNTVLPVLVGLVGGVQEVHDAARGDQTQVAESVAKGVGQLVTNVTQLLKREALDRLLEVIEEWETDLVEKTAGIGGEAASPAKGGGGSCNGDDDTQYSQALAWNADLLRFVERATGFAEESRSVGNSAFIQGNVWSEEREKQVQALQRDLGRLATSSRSEEQKVELEAWKTATETENEAKTLVITAQSLKEKKSELTSEYNQLAAEKLRVAQLMARLSKDISEVVRISSSVPFSPPPPSPPALFTPPRGNLSHSSVSPLWISPTGPPAWTHPAGRAGPEGVLREECRTGPCRKEGG